MRWGLGLLGKGVSVLSGRKAGLLLQRRMVRRRGRRGGDLLNLCYGVGVSRWLAMMDLLSLTWLPSSLPCCRVVVVVLLLSLVPEGGPSGRQVDRCLVLY